MDMQRISGRLTGAKGSGLTDRASSGEAKEAFSAILAEIREDAQQMAAGLAGASTQPLAPSQAIAAIETNQEIAAEKAREAAAVEIVRRLLPDGTIRVSKYQGGKLAKVFYNTPDKIAVPDYQDPSWHKSPSEPEITGVQKKMKLVPHQSVFDGVFF